MGVFQSSFIQEISGKSYKEHYTLEFADIAVIVRIYEAVIMAVHKNHRGKGIQYHKLMSVEISWFRLIF